MPNQRDQAIALMQQKRFTEAVPLLRSLAEINPEDADIHYMLGQCYRFTNNIFEAVKSLESAATLAPHDDQIFLALGIAHQLLEDYDDSIRALRHAIDLNPSLFSAYNSLGLTYKKSGQYRKAIELYSQAAEGIVSAISEEVYQDDEKCFREEVVEGIKTVAILPYTFEKTRDLLRSDPRYAIFKNNIGVCLAELGYIEAAKEQFEESIEFIPDDYEYPDPYRNLEQIS